MKSLKSQLHNLRSRLTIQIILTVAVIALLASLAACSGGSSSNQSSNSGANTSGTSGTQAGTTQMQVSMGDAPADQVLAFSMTINSMSLTGSSTVNLVTSPMPFEMMHVMGTMQPIAMLAVPQGSYTGATMTIGSAVVSYMNPTTRTVVQTTISSPMTVPITFSSPMTVGTTPMALGFDMDMAHSISINASGNVTMNPTFHVSMGTQGSGNPLDPANGGVQHMVGTISGVSGNTFTMSMLQSAQSFTFQTNSSTNFQGGISGMGMMSNNMVTLVDATLQPDGSLLAQRVQSLMNSGGMMGEGVMTTVTGTPATQLTMLMRNGVGAGMMSSFFANSATVSVGSGTIYRMDTDDMPDMTGLPFTPVFDQNNIHVGQNVQSVSATAMMSGGVMMSGGMTMAGTITGSEVDLEQQGFSGTVSNYTANSSAATFTLTIAPDSAFTSMTGGATSLTVFQQTGTTVSGLTSITNGATVQVRGLLFLDAGTWKLVASRITAP